LEIDRRRRIGLAAVAILVVGGLHFLFQPATYDWVPVAAACVRVGTVLGLLWLAYPDLRMVPGWLWGGILIGGIVLALRPRLAVVVIPLAALLWVLRK